MNWLADSFGISYLDGAVVTLRHQIRYQASACEMVMLSSSQTSELPPGTPVSSHTNTNIGANEHDTHMLYNLFRNRCKINKCYT